MFLLLNDSDCHHVSDDDDDDDHGHEDHDQHTSCDGLCLSFRERVVATLRLVMES